MKNSKSIMFCLVTIAILVFLSGELQAKEQYFNGKVIFNTILKY